MRAGWAHRRCTITAGAHKPLRDELNPMARSSFYDGQGKARAIYEQEGKATFEEMRVVLDVFATMLPQGYCPYPKSRVTFRFGTFKIGCLENAEACRHLADRFKKPANYNLGGFHFPSRAGGYSKKNATKIDEHLLECELLFDVPDVLLTKL